MTDSGVRTAALIVIGNEILSGRTQDVHVQYVGDKFSALGVNLVEVRMIPDERKKIVMCLRELKGQVDYVLTTGGIGPTHDDITSECVAEALNLKWCRHPEAWEILKKHYEMQAPPVEFNEPRQRMAMMPENAELIPNPVSSAPGFKIQNIFVLAGVPKIMRAMFESVLSQIDAGPRFLSETIRLIGVREGQIAQKLSEIQNQFPAVTIGSYPFYDEEGGGVAIVIRGRDEVIVTEAAHKVRAQILS